MEKNLDQWLDRREFIRKIMRYLISTVLSISSFALIFKKIKVSDDERCFNHFLCQDCVKLSDCNLQSALKVKGN